MPSITQTRRGAPVYAALLEAFHVYLPMLIALKKFADATQTERSKSTPVETLLFTFPPLLYGLGAINLRADALAGRGQRTSYCLAVELALVCFVMAQLQSILAETQTHQALRVQSEGSLRKAEQAWQNAQYKFTRAVSNATRDLGSMPSDDPLLSSMRSLIDGARLQAAMLSQMCAIHRVTLRVAIVRLSVQSSFVWLSCRLIALFVAFAACIRRRSADRAVGPTGLPPSSSRVHDRPPDDLTSVGLARQRVRTFSPVVSAHAMEFSTNAFTAFNGNSLCRQLAWVLQVQEVRWKAMYYDQELTIFHLDVQPGNRLPV